MPRQSSDALEAEGLDVLEKLGMPAIGNLHDVLLRNLDPNGDHSRDEHCEFDYLIPDRDCCLVGEITDRNFAHVAEKFTRYRRQLNVVRNLALRDGLTDFQWRSLGVPYQRLRHFRSVREIKGFFIATNHEEFDEKLGGRQLRNVAVFYRPDWFLLRSYAKTLGSYGRYHLEAALDISPEAGPQALHLTKSQHSLIVLEAKAVALGRATLAAVYTFEVSPYLLLPIARVFRRDLLPDLSPRRQGNYQRPLLSEKLREIRKTLSRTGDFLFPSNILVTLNHQCRYDRRHETLVIPSHYGSVEVIDGQHRLFSYADHQVEKRRRDDARIMVTAIRFNETDSTRANRYSARIFVEINGNQTRIAPSHLDAIAYPILGETTPAALAAVVITKLNEKVPTRGIFKTSQTRLGVIRPATVAREIRPIVALEAIRSLSAREDADRLRGYSRLLRGDQRQLTRAPALIDRAAEALAQYCSRLSRVFHHDWPSRDKERASALEYAKVFASLIMLFDTFLSEGLTWTEVQRELEQIRGNILQLRRLDEYHDVLLADHDGIPDSGPTVQDDFKFFDANRRTPTPIQAVVTERRRPQRKRGRSRR